MKRSNADETTLLKRVLRQGDVKALEQLHTMYYRSVFRYVARRVGLTADAEDLTQDVFIELFKANGCYDGHGAVEGYIFGIARNAVRRHGRLTARRPRTVEPYSIEEFGCNRSIERYADPEHQVSSRELAESIQDALGKLPPKAREALKLRFIQGLSTGEAASLVGCSTSTFYKRLERAVKAFRELRQVRQIEYR